VTANAFANGSVWPCKLMAYTNPAMAHPHLMEIHALRSMWATAASDCGKPDAGTLLDACIATGAGVRRGALSG